MIDGICIRLVEEEIIVAAAVNVYFLLILVLILVLLLFSSYHVAQFPLLVAIVRCVIQEVAADLCDSAPHVRQWEELFGHFRLLLWHFSFFSLIVIVIFTRLRLDVAKELFDRIGAFTTVIKIAAI